MKELILFSQAPADIQYILALYNKNKNDYRVTIVVVNVFNSFKFFNSLNLNAEIKFIPIVGQGKIIKFLKFSIELRNIYQDIFANISDAKVYFFANNYDYVSAYCIEKLMKSNTIYFYNIYKIDGNVIVGLSAILKSFLTKILFGINIKFFKIADTYAYQYLYNKNKVIELELKVEENELEEYKYKIAKNDNNKKNLLFFESNGQLDKSFKNYEEDVKFIMDKLIAKYNIYIKPHPRLGYSNILVQYNINLIDEYIPSELVNMDAFDMVLGIDSTSIATSQHHNKYSLINLFEFSDEKRQVYLINYLNKLSDDKLPYIDNVNEF